MAQPRNNEESDKKDRTAAGIYARHMLHTPHEFEEEREMGRDIIVAVLLFLMAVGHTFSDAPFPYLSWSLCGGFLVALILRERAFRHRERFVNQLKSHRRELRNGGTVVVDQALVRYDTLLTTYIFTIGGLVTSIIVPSRYHHWTGEAPPQSLAFTLISWCTGWWCLGGPVTTVRCGIYNLRGGRIKSVAELIDKPLLARLNRAEQMLRAELEEEAARIRAERREEEKKRADAAQAFTGNGSRSGTALARASSQKLRSKHIPVKPVSENPLDQLHLDLEQRFQPLRVKAGELASRAEKHPMGRGTLAILRAVFCPTQPPQRPGQPYLPGN